jgi:3-oxoadipate enol-lactonase
MGATGRIYGEGIGRALEAGYSMLIVEPRSPDDLRGRPWSTSWVADDVAAVLDEVGAGRAHISGASLGGMVAQEVALRYPGRTGALVLASTTGGWPRWDLYGLRGVFALLRSAIGSSRRDLPPEQRVQRAMGVWFSPEFARNAGAGSAAWELLASILEEGVPSDVRRMQLVSAMRHSTWSRLSRIGAPTLIQHGGQDRLISPRAGRALARRIPDARFHLWPRAGHALGVEIPEPSYSLALEFVKQHDHLLAPRNSERTAFAS